jgi:hypothetical protein
MRIPELGSRDHLAFMESSRAYFSDRLHHMMIARSGIGRSDLTCPLLGMIGERIYSVGNEREVSRLNKKGNYGVFNLTQPSDCSIELTNRQLHLRVGDSLHAVPELMNESKKPISVYITMVSCPSPRTLLPCYLLKHRAEVRNRSQIQTNLSQRS